MRALALAPARDNTTQMVLSPPMTTPLVLWTGGLQMIRFKVEPAVYPSVGGALAPPTDCISHAEAKWIPGDMTKMRSRSSAVYLPQSITNVECSGCL